MRYAKLTDMQRGWFVGDFEPTVLRTPDVEVAVKQYRAGDVEETHHHRVATELTVIVAGRALMNGRPLEHGDIAVIEPGEAAMFGALTDVLTVVVKLPSVQGDKYPGKMGDA